MISLWSADNETTGRVHQKVDVALDEFLGQHWFDYFLNRSFPDIFQLHFRCMLRRQYDGVDTVRLAIDISDCYLRLGIWTQPGQAAIVAQLRLALHHEVRQVNCQWHQGWGFVAGIAEHQPLVARALIQIIVGCAIHALGDVGALLVISDQYSAALVINAVFGVVIADALDGVACHLNVIDIGGGGDFASKNYESGVGQCFSSYPCIRVLR
jgi:hypothetical protein